MDKNIKCKQEIHFVRTVGPQVLSGKQTFFNVVTLFLQQGKGRNIPVGIYLLMYHIKGFPILHRKINRSVSHWRNTVPTPTAHLCG